MVRPVGARRYDQFDIEPAYISGTRTERPLKVKRKALGPDFTDKLSYFTEPMPEQSLEGTAVGRLLDQVNELQAADRALLAAGVPASEFSGLKGLSVPEINGGVPAAYKVPLGPGVEKRIHTQYRDDIIPGHKVVVGYGSKGGSAPLTTTLGDARTGLVDLEGHQHATEYIQEKLMKLAGLPVQRANSRNVHDVDFTIGDARIDGEIRFDTEGSNLPVQVYTKVQPRNMQGLDAQGVKQAVGQLMAQQFAEGRSIVSGVQELERQGAIRRPIEGKLLKDIDQLIMTKLPKEAALRNKKSGDQIAIAPGCQGCVFGCGL